MDNGHMVAVTIIGDAGVESLTHIMQDATITITTPKFLQAEYTIDGKLRRDVVGHVDSLPGFLVALAAVIERGANVDFVRTAKGR